MSEICNVCGLPKDLCICQTIAREQQQIVVRLETKRFRKKVTVLEGLAQSGVDLNSLAKKLKARFACGGQVTERREIVLQGDHRKFIKGVLAKDGFNPDTIKVE